MKIEVTELQKIVDALGYSITDLDDIEILAACDGTSCQQACQNGCQHGCSSSTGSFEGDPEQQLSFD